MIVAKKYCEENNIDAYFIYADILNLPFKDKKFDLVFSFSVLQHFPRDKFFKVVKEVRKLLNDGGLFKFQIMNVIGIRSLYNNLILRHKTKKYFFPEFYFPYKIIKYSKNYYSSASFVNCSFFTQANEVDYELFNVKYKFLFKISSFFNFIQKYIPFLKYFSDNLYINLKK